MAGLVLALIMLAAAGAVTPADGRPATAVVRDAASLRATAPDGRLRFGIYPGGGVGLVNDTGTARASRPQDRMQALQRLRGDGRELVLHLYSAWDGMRPATAAVAEALAEVRSYTAAGFPVEPVLRYRPQRRTGARAVRGYVAHVRRTVRELVKNRRVVGVQITNEANVRVAPDAADGAYGGAREALVQGVIAAAAEVRRAGRGDLRVGFNWAAGGGSRSDAAFWRGLKRAGGRPFARATDWVGIDIYPGTWSHHGTTDAAGVRSAMTRTVRHVRTVGFRRAGLGRGTALHITENGFPTGAGRDEATQASLMRAAIETVEGIRERYGITDYRWFDLRDSRTGEPGLEHGYGILRDDYTEKPGFAVLAELIRRYGR